MNTEELTAELTAQKETIYQPLAQLQEEREERQRRDMELAALLAPVGTIAAFGGSSYENVPAGWLLCDGRSLNKTQYLQLFAVIGIAWGHGDNPPDTFNLPDLRGRFLRGVDLNTSPWRDPDRDTRVACSPGGNEKVAVGSLQAGATMMPLKPFQVSEGEGTHNHNYNATNNIQEYLFKTGDGPGASLTRSIMSNLGGGEHDHTITGGDSETRPVNAYVLWMIKIDT